MPKVGIVMGSDSDMKVMGKAADMLEKFGIDYEMTIISAHRELPNHPAAQSIILPRPSHGRGSLSAHSAPRSGNRRRRCR